MTTKKSIIALGIIVLPGLIFFCVVLEAQKSGDNLFAANVLDPIPKSVTILNSDNNGWDGIVWLHFKISPSDLNLILKSKKWDVHPDLLIGADADENPEVKDWWNARLLGENAIKYYVVIDYNGHERIDNMWVNAQRDEVFYKVTSIY